MKTPLDKETYIKLAEAYCKQEAYECKVRESVKNIADEHDVYTGFIGFTISTQLIMSTILKLLGDEFDFFFYECDRSFDKYNSSITHKDGSHPDVKDFGDLWEFESKLHEENK